ncbi:MAG: zinc ribbon domain-containing protein [Candidatus Omnitrophica bacterium]|nr:zinc ribbon domain-containing protein [Candidatus Omnitrophota bacterium]
MPTYQYICNDCGQKFDFYMSISEKESGKKPNCPNCNSSNVIKVFGNITIIGSRSGGSNLPPVCGPKAGPGCCR